MQCDKGAWLLSELGGERPRIFFRVRQDSPALVGAVIQLAHSYNRPYSNVKARLMITWRLVYTGNIVEANAYVGIKWRG